MRKRDQNSSGFFNEILPKDKTFIKSFIFSVEPTDLKTIKKNQPSEFTNKENGTSSLKSQDNKSQLDKDWVKIFDTKQAVIKISQDSTRQSQLQNFQQNVIPTIPTTVPPKKQIIIFQSSSFRISYLDFAKTYQSQDKQFLEIQKMVFIDQTPKPKPLSPEQSLASKYTIHNYKKQNDLKNNSIHLNLDAGYGLQLSIQKPHDKSICLKTQSFENSQVLNHTNLFKLSQEVVQTNDIKNQNEISNKKNQIPRSYLEAQKGTVTRTNSEKLLHQIQQQKPSHQTSDSKSNANIQPMKLYYISSIIQAFQSKEDNTLTDLAKDHIQQMVQGVKYALNQCPANEIKKIYLPKQDKKRTIVFDLDETLIHCNSECSKPSDIVLQIIFPGGETMKAAINIRPYAQYVLETLSKSFEIIIFTASHSSYANKIIEYLDPKNQWISHKFFREHCIQITEGIFIKDLRILGNRNLQDLLLVDNSAFSFAFQLENGVPIIPYYDDKNDEQLRHLQRYLMQFKDEKDVRILNSQQMKMKQYGQYGDAVDLLRGEFKDLI